MFAIMSKPHHQVVSDDHSTMTSLWTSIDTRKSSLKRPGRGPYRGKAPVQCIVIASLSLFAAGVVLAAAGFGPMLNTTSSRRSAVVINLQPPCNLHDTVSLKQRHTYVQCVCKVAGSSLLGMAGTVWVAGAVIYFKGKRRVKRRQSAARLRNRVQLHALAIDVLHRRPEPGQDLLSPAAQQQLLDQLRLLEACEKERESLVTRSNSTLAILSPTFESRRVQNSVSNLTGFVNGKCDGKGLARKDEQQEDEDMAVPLSDDGDVSQQPASVSNLPGIYISHAEQSDAGECDGEKFYYDVESHVRCESYSGGGCTLMVRQTDGSNFSSGTSLFTSVPSSSRCSLPLGDSGWEGDVSHGGSLSTVSRRDSLSVPASDVLAARVPTNFLPLPFTSGRRHSTSSADQKSETWNYDRLQRLARFCEARCTTCDDSGATVTRRNRTCQEHTTLDVCCSISTSRSLSDSMYVSRFKQYDVSELADSPRRRLTTAPTDRKRRRRRKDAPSRRVTDPELRAIWISDLRQHTDDSDVERRVERILYEIDHSVTDSVDESKIQSPEFEFLSD